MPRLYLQWGQEKPVHILEGLCAGVSGSLHWREPSQWVIARGSGKCCLAMSLERRE